MSLKVENLEHNMAKLTVELPAQDLEKALESSYHKNRKKINIPGFRKGKAPRFMIERMYGPEIFYNDAADELINSGLRAEVYGNEELKIVSRPQVEVTQIEKGEPFIFTAVVALKPEIELGKYKGVKVEKISTEVTEEDVDKEIENERERNARTVSVEDRPVKSGDITIIDFEGFIDGEPFEGGKGENYSLTIGSGSFIPGFEDQLIGAEINEEKEIKVTFPEDYNAEQLAGKEAVFKVIIHEIKEKELPELDDEFAEEVSEYETLSEYRDSLKEKLKEQKEKAARAQKEDKLLEAIVKDSNMDIPDAMVEEQAARMADDYANRLQLQGLTLDQYFMFTGLNMDKFIEQMKPNALKRIQTSLVIEKVTELEGFTVTDEEYEDEIKQMADEYKMSLDSFKDMLDENSRGPIEDDIKVKKAIDLIIDSAIEE
ncbi:MAG TPA: trigger factor [Lachnospiraceae bacterium]|nr:trigger factor [Lachnospiraceae bacterium]